MSEEATLDEFTQQSEDSEEKFNSTKSKINLPRLEEYISIIKGTKPDRVSDEQHDDSEPYLVVSTLTGEDRKFTPDTDGPKATPRDTLMIMDGSKSGRVYRGEDGIIGSTMAAIRPEGTNSHYLRYFLESNFERLNSATKGSAVPHTDKDLLRSLEYPVYPLSEQRKVATVLYTVDRAIEKTKEIVKQIERTEQALKQSLFFDGYFDHSKTIDAHHQNRLLRHPAEWQTKPAGEVMEVTRGSHPRPKSDDTLWRGEIPIVKIGDRNRGDARTVSSTDDTVTKKGSKKSKLVNEGTLIVSNAGTVGTARITGMQTCIHDHWLILRDYEENLSTRYLYYFINWNQEFLEALASGSTVLDLNTDDFRLFDVTFPSLEEQQKISDTLDALHDQKMTNIEYSGQLQRLKRGLIQDLLSGTVRTTDTNIEVPEEIAKHG